MPQRRFIPLGVITTPHGVRGAFKIKPFTDNPDALDEHTPWQDRQETSYPFSIVSHAKGQWVCRMDGVADRAAAAALRGTELGLWRDQLPETAGNEYYVADLVGMQVTTTSGEPFGEVAAVQHYGASELLEIRLISGGKTELFPFTHSVFPDIRAEEKIIIIEPPVVI